MILGHFKYTILFFLLCLSFLLEDFYGGSPNKLQKILLFNLKKCQTFYLKFCEVLKTTWNFNNETLNWFNEFCFVQLGSKEYNWNRWPVQFKNVICQPGFKFNIDRKIFEELLLLKLLTEIYWYQLYWESLRYTSVEKFSTLVLFSVLFGFKNTAVPPRHFQYSFIVTYFIRFTLGVFDRNLQGDSCQ